MEIWAKSNRVTLKEHVENLLKALDYLPFDRLNYENLKIENIEINENFLKKLLKWAIFFHDLGKVSPTFQKNTLKNENYNIDSFPENFPKVRHNILSLFFINKEKVFTEICKNNENLYITFLSAIAFHHWKVDEKEYLLHINDDLIKASKMLLENGNGNKFSEVLKKHFEDFNLDEIEVEEYIKFDEDLAKHILNQGNLLSIGLVAPYTLYFLPERLRAKIENRLNLNLWIFLVGFLIRVDHFASMVEKDEEIEINLEEIEKKAPSTNLTKKLEEKFGKDFWQGKVLNCDKDGNLVLVAPAGIGKTEFAFLWAEENKFFYTLPLRVATNQIFERACEYFNVGISEEDEDPFVNGNIGLLHSDADLYLYERWESFKGDVEGEIPKILDLSRHFSLSVNICTGDQIFSAALKYPQYEKIYATLSYSRLIIDEIQAYDPKACAIIVKMIEDVVSLGGKFLLMTATLPKFLKELLIERKIINEDKIIDYYNYIENIVRHKIELKEKDIVEDVEEIIGKAKEGKRVLVVLNTIKKAEKIYDKIKEKIGNEKIYIDLIHSRFTYNKRKEKETELKKRFENPKLTDEKDPKILVATQVVEASLDIDADYLFTEIAPMDALIQRMGRVMRRVDLLTGKIKGTYNDFKYEDFYKNSEPNVFIYYQKEKEKKILESGKGKVYEQHLLKRTLEVLNEKNEIKEKEKQRLVEEVYENLKNSNYLRDFYETLSILDVGYVSENKAEAHNLFREISTISVVEEDKIQEILQKIVNKIDQDKKITWLWFKKEIIAEYVINDYIWNYKKVESLWNKLEYHLEDELKRKNFVEEGIKKYKEQLKKYCNGIYFVSDGALKDNII